MRVDPMPFPIKLGRWHSFTGYVSGWSLKCISVPYVCFLVISSQYICLGRRSICMCLAHDSWLLTMRDFRWVAPLHLEHSRWYGVLPSLCWGYPWSSIGGNIPEHSVVGGRWFRYWFRWSPYRRMGSTTSLCTLILVFVWRSLFLNAPVRRWPKAVPTHFNLYAMLS